MNVLCNLVFLERCITKKKKYISKLINTVLTSDYNRVINKTLMNRDKNQIVRGCGTVPME